MFKKSSTTTSPDLFSGFSQHMRGRKLKQIEDPNAWHNFFFREITSRIDEGVFSVMYDNKNGRPNAPIRILVAMLILKDGNDWTDEQLFEACNFNLLVSRALGLVNVSDEAPCGATYYNFKLALLEYEQQTGINLLEKCFHKLTQDQVLRYKVSGATVRMDSKLLQSNIAKNSRLQLCLGVITKFYKSLSEQQIRKLKKQQVKELKEISGQSVEQYTYRLNKQASLERLDRCGHLVLYLLKVFDGMHTEEYALLHRLWEEQFELVKDDTNQGANPKPKDVKNQPGSTLQSPHDADATYRNKPGSKKQMVTGYVCNITETSVCQKDDADKSADDETSKPAPLNLILDVQTERATFSDDKFFQPAIQRSEELLQCNIENAFSDGAYNSPSNEQFTHENERDLKWYLTAIQGVEGNYDFEQIAPDTYKVTDRRTGQVQTTVLTSAGKYRIKIGHANSPYRYFDTTIITNYFRRREIEAHQKWVCSHRANVEATIRQVFCTLKGSKTKYRGLFQHQCFALNRAFWSNFKRILKTCDNSLIKSPVYELLVAMRTILQVRNHFPITWILSSNQKIFYRYFNELSIVMVF